MMERTCLIIKPDAVKDGHEGAIITRYRREGYKTLAMKMCRPSREQFEQFYAVHKERPFFTGLIDFMSSGPIVIMVIEREDGIRKAREISGATNPANAAEGTIRKQFATNIEKNCVHISDAPETAGWEIGFWFSQAELIS